MAKDPLMGSMAYHEEKSQPQFTATFAYDGLGRTTRIHYPLAGTTNYEKFAYAYTQAGLSEREARVGLPEGRSRVVAHPL